ncbi:DNA-processing protein DprA [Aquincola sp. MAHUQ-54]|uniref:DNA-processing protein DprA n=1 Tax=Aquincola agrisoli TaxID=3119538 RepID=A0AAW9QD15_9BURK
MDTDELTAWLRLLETPGIGRSRARRLMAAFGSPQAAVQAPQAALADVIGPALALALSTPSDGLTHLIEGTLAWLARGEQRAVITLGDPAYPALLLETADPPLMLYAQGRLELLAKPSIAIVGSRRPSAQGADNAKAFGAALSAAGFTVVSGMALGVDGAAHQGALDGPGSTIAVVGTGLDRVYPGRHRALAHRIAREGLLLSEFALGSLPLREHFPLRNRIIAGMTRGTLVVEAALASGSLITARLAAEGGREVFAIPGSIHAPQSRGCHALIRQGAALVEQVEDILCELRAWSPVQASPPAARPAQVPDDTDPVLRALGHEPATLDALIDRCGWPAPRLNARLLELELDGAVTRLPGGFFQRRGLA